MIRRQNELGEIAVSNNVYTYIAGSAATNCFGVKGMAIPVSYTHLTLPTT